MFSDNHVLERDFKLDDLPELPAGKAKMDVTFNINANGCLQVTVVDKQNPNNTAVKVIEEFKADLSKSQVDRMVQAAETYKAQDEANKRRADARIALESACFRIKNRVNQPAIASQLPESSKRFVLNLFQEGIDFIENNPRASAQQFNGKREEIEVGANALLNQFTQPQD